MKDVAEGVRPDWLGDPGPAGDAAQDPPGGVAVEASTVRSAEDGTVEALANR